MIKHIDPQILQAVKNILQKHFSTKLDISSVVYLSEQKRKNVVLRIHLQSDISSILKSVILKQSLPEQSDTDDKRAYARFTRDWASLEFLSKIQQKSHNIAKFYGAHKKYRFILIEDLGDQHISLVDSLTYPDRDKAISALSRFMKSLGSLHASSYGHTDLYQKILQKINQDADTPQDDLNFLLADLLPILKSANENLHLPVTTALVNEATEIITSVIKPGPFTVLAHGDICPDNVFDHQDTKELQLIDFEWAFVRSALLDGTYLRMSMPTCWCVKAIPTDVILMMETIYREELKRTIPAAWNDTAYCEAYTNACGFWILQQTLPFLDGILLQDRVASSGPTPEGSLWKPNHNLVRPRFLSRLQSFIDVSSQHDLLPYMREMARNMLIAAKLKWPNTNLLEFYPAFIDT